MGLGVCLVLAGVQVAATIVSLAQRGELSKIDGPFEPEWSEVKYLQSLPKSYKKES